MHSFCQDISDFTADIIFLDMSMYYLL